MLHGDAAPLSATDKSARRHRGATCFCPQCAQSSTAPHARLPVSSALLTPAPLPVPLFPTSASSAARTLTPRTCRTPLYPSLDSVAAASRAHVLSYPHSCPTPARFFPCSSPVRYRSGALSHARELQFRIALLHGRYSFGPALQNFLSLSSASVAHIASLRTHQ